MKLSHKLTIALCLAMLCAPRMASVDAQQARPNQQNNGNGNQGNGNGNQGNGNGNQGNGKNDQDEDNDVESKIDADIQGPERSVIHNAMRGLRREDRENVMLLGADGLIYANKTWLKDACEVPQKIDDNLYQDRNGRQFALPTSTPKPMQETTPAGSPLSQVPSGSGAAAHFGVSRPNVFKGETYGGSGAYRRVYSKIPMRYNAEDLSWEYDDTAPGYSYEEGYVTLPSRLIPRLRPNVQEVTHAVWDRASGTRVYKGDTACIYMGGWSAGYTAGGSTSGPAGASIPYLAADGGLQHDNGINILNPRTATGKPTRDSWAMFMKVDRGVQQNGLYEDQVTFVANAIRFVANQTVGMNFCATQGTNGRTYLCLNVNGYAKDYQTGAIIDGPGPHNWTMLTDVTLAVTAGPSFSPWNVNGTGVVLKRMTTIAQDHPENLHSCSIVRNVQWSNCKIGITGGIPALWDKNSYGGQEDYPATHHVTVSNFTFSGETDTVSLCSRG